jgi:AraC family transcriptional regulator
MGTEVLAKIAVSSLASGDGWSVSDVVCTSGPHDRPFEEQHSNHSIAVVVSGTFQYRSAKHCELMTPGSLLMGNAGQGFTCGHEHGTGDRCLSFSYTPEFFERLASDAGAPRMRFDALRIPPIRAVAPLVAQASAVLAGVDRAACEELSIKVAAQAILLERGITPRQTSAEPSSFARVTRVVRMIENDPDEGHDLAGLARMARLSPYHFLRTFEGLTGTTPHQYLLRIVCGGRLCVCGWAPRGFLTSRWSAGLAMCRISTGLSGRSLESARGFTGRECFAA